MTRKRYLDLFVRFAGWMLVAASVVFVVVVGQTHWAAISGMALSPRVWIAIGGLVLLYGTALLLTGVLWHAMLAFTAAGASGLRHSMRAHTGAQLAKYVPGNVFHFLGRHMIHRAAGADDKRLALAALLENLVLLAAALCIAVVCLVLGKPGLYRDIALIVGAGLVILLVALVVALRARNWPLAPLMTGFACALLFFAIMAGIVAAIAVLLGTGFAWETGGSGVAAWIAGFVVPGSPGGLGVREAAMVLLGGHAAKPDVLLMVALLFRVVTFGGDLVCAALGRVLFREANRLAA